MIIVEGITSDFYEHLWRFITDGKYQSLEQSKKRARLYRFHSPDTENYPYMIELLTRNILDLQLPTHLTPTPVNDDISSLSAILMDDAYYYLVLDHRTSAQGANIIPASCLIPLKARAWQVKKWPFSMIARSLFSQHHRFPPGLYPQHKGFFAES